MVYVLIKVTLFNFMIFIFTRFHFNSAFDLFFCIINPWHYNISEYILFLYIFLPWKIQSIWVFGLDALATHWSFVSTPSITDITPLSTAENWFNLIIYFIHVLGLTRIFRDWDKIDFLWRLNYLNFSDFRSKPWIFRMSLTFIFARVFKLSIFDFKRIISTVAIILLISKSNFN